MNPSSPKVPSSGRLSVLGFSFYEVVVAITVAGILATIAISSLVNTHQTVVNTKLQTDVTKLNQLVTAYLGAGGSLAGLTAPQDVLDKLKTTLSASDTQTSTGPVTGRLVDVRLVAVPQSAQEAASAAPRAVWNPGNIRFEIVTSGTGAVGSFDLDDSLAAKEYGTEIRAKSAESFNSTNGWVWGKTKSSGAPTAVGPTDIQLSSTTVSPAVFDPTNTTSTATSPSMLPLPTLSPSGGVFPMANFPYQVTIYSNVSPSVTASILQYEITHADGSNSGLQTYSGPVSITFGDSVAAENISTYSALYTNSGVNMQTYNVQTTALPAPTITPSGGSFTGAAFPTVATIGANGAPGGSSSYLQYQIVHSNGSNSGWSTYANAVPVTYGDTVQAQNISTNAVLYTNSALSSANYQVTATTLPTPTITPAGGSFNLASFPGTVTISSNGAPGGAYSALQYQVTHSDGSSTNWTAYTAAVTITYGDTVAARNNSTNTQLYITSASASQSYNVTATPLPVPIMTPNGGTFETAVFPTSVSISANGAPGGTYSTLQYQITHTGGSSTAWTNYSGPVAITYGDTVAAQNVTSNATFYITSSPVSNTYKVTPSTLPTPSITPAGGSFQVANFPTSATISANGAPSAYSTLQYQIVHSTGASTGWANYTAPVAITYGDVVSAQSITTNSALYSNSAQASQSYQVTPTPLPTPAISPTGGSFQQGSFPSSVTISSNGAPGGSGSTLQYQITHANGASTSWQAYSAAITVTSGDTVYAQNISANSLLYSNSSQTSQNYVQITTLPTPVITPAGGSFVATNFPSSVTVSSNGAPGGTDSSLQYQITHVNGASSAWTTYSGAISIAYGDTVAAQNLSTNASLYNTSQTASQTYEVTPTTLPTPVITPTGGSFQQASFPSSVTISSNGAPGGTNSTLQYQITHSGGGTTAWTTYSSAVPISPGDTVVAQNNSNNTTLYTTSAQTSQTYVEITTLPTPVITPTGGSFQQASFPSSVTISANGAPTGNGSTLQYQITHANGGGTTAWTTYANAVSISPGDTVVAQNLSTNTSLYNTSAQTSQTYGEITTLPTPVITPTGGSFQQASFPSSVTISANGAPGGSSSTLQYQINHTNGSSTTWATYTGAITITFGDTVVAQNLSNNLSLYNTSAQNSQTYQEISTLPTPVITPAGGSFVATNFPSAVTISANGAPTDGSSTLQYNITHTGGATTGWQPYTGAVSITYGDAVAAQNLSNNASHYNNSGVANQTYAVTPITLPTPSITPAGGSFAQASFPSSATISSNNAPANYSVLQYNVTHVNGTSTGWTTYTGPVSITYGDTVAAQNLSSNTVLYTTSASASQTYNVTPVVLPAPGISPAGGSFVVANFPTRVTLSSNGAPGDGSSLLLYNVTHTDGTSSGWANYGGFVPITYGDTVSAQNQAANTQLYTNSPITTQTYTVTPTVLPTPVITPTGGAFMAASFPNSATISSNGAPGGTYSTLQYQVTSAAGVVGAWTTYTGALTLAPGETLAAQNISNNAAFYTNSGVTSQTYTEITTLPTPIITPTGGSFVVANFPSAVTVSANGAPGGTSSTLQYMIKHSNGATTAWATYSAAVSITYGDTVYAQNLTNNASLYATSAQATQTYSVTPTGLPTPALSPSGGSFVVASFPGTVSVSANGAPSGSSTLQYNITHSNGSSTGWTNYSNPVSVTYGDTVAAQNLTSNSALYTTSSPANQSYNVTPTALPAPVITPAGGAFVVGSFPATVTVSSNGAPGTGGSVLQYNITHSNGSSTGWTNYNSAVAIAYGDTVTAQNMASNTQLYTTSSPTSQTYTVTPATLPTPIISPTGGTFTTSNFPSSVTISANGAPAGYSTLQYMITHSNGVSTSWATYSGGVSIAWGDTVMAQNVTSNSSLYITSATTSQTYTISNLFVGTISPSWTSPTGGSNLSDTINNSNPSSIYFGYGNTSLTVTGLDGSSNPNSNTNYYADITNNGKTESSYAGAINLTYDGQNFNTFCVAVSTGINLGSSYKDFSLVSGTSYFGNTKIVTELGELITSYGGLLGNALDDAAFQYAVWEIQNETSGTLGLGSGSFQVSGGNSAQPIALANSWLSNLGTADNVTVSVLSSPTAQSQIIWQSSTSTAPAPVTIPDSMTFNVNGINVPPGTSFTAGTLLIKNGTTQNSSAATGVTLQLVLNLTAPVSGTYTANVKFAINAPDGGGSSDTVTLSNPTTGLSIKVGSTTYAFNVSLATTDTTNGSISGNVLTIKKGCTLTAQLNGMFK